MRAVMFKLWVVLSAVWLGYVYLSRHAWEFPLLLVAAAPVIGLGLLFGAITWIGIASSHEY